MHISPMLAEEANEAQKRELLHQAWWWAAEKLDGHRLIIQCGPDGVVGIGRSGVKAIPPRIEDFFRSLGASSLTEFDGELIGKDYYCFDLPHIGDVVNHHTAFYKRYAALKGLFGLIQPPDYIHLVEHFSDLHDKEALLARVEADGGEGVMFRHCDGVYRSGRRSVLLLKYKFTHTADVIVLGLGIGGKNNAELGIVDTTGNIVSVGKCSMEYKEPVQPGDVIEVKYLYCVSRDAPRLVQPRMIRKRPDKQAHECLISQLHWTVKRK